jgi:hypothetical protein
MILSEVGGGGEPEPCTVLAPNGRDGAGLAEKSAIFCRAPRNPARGSESLETIRKRVTSTKLLWQARRVG